MKLLYIHGLHSQPRADKNAILEEFAESVFAPKIDYFGTQPVFSWLLEICKTQQIDALVGSSAGGLMAFWLNKYVGVKALLFNPALKFQSFASDIIEPSTEDLQQNYFNYIILGEKDDVVNPQDTINYLQEKESTENYQLNKIENLGHQIDLETFRFALEKFVEFNQK